MPRPSHDLSDIYCSVQVKTYMYKNKTLNIILDQFPSCISEHKLVVSSCCCVHLSTRAGSLIIFMNSKECHMNKHEQRPPHIYNSETNLT